MSKPTYYQIKSGTYAGKYHVRVYISKGKYFHIGRFNTEAEAREACLKGVSNV